MLNRVVRKKTIREYDSKGNLVREQTILEDGGLGQEEAEKTLEKSNKSLKRMDKVFDKMNDMFKEMNEAFKEIF